jgi:hypothetical protein
MTNLTHFFMYFYFIFSHVSSITVLIIRRSNCINTSSDMIILFKWLLGMPVRREMQFLPDRHTKQSHRLIILDDILIQFDLLMMSTVMLETCREIKYINTWKSASSWSLVRISWTFGLRLLPWRMRQQFLPDRSYVGGSLHGVVSYNKITFTECLACVDVLPYISHKAAPLHATKGKWAWQVKLHLFLTSAFDESGLSASRLGLFNPATEPPYGLNSRLGGASEQVWLLWKWDKSLAPYRELNHDSSDVSYVA